MKSEFSIDIVLDKRYKKKSGLYPVKLWVYSTVRQKSKRLPTAFSLSEKDFNLAMHPEIKKLKKPPTTHTDLRRELDAAKNQAIKDAKAIIPFDLDIYCKKYDRKVGDGNNVFYHYEQVIEDLKKNEQLGSASSYGQSMKSLKAFRRFKITGKIEDKNIKLTEGEIEAANKIDAMPLPFSEVNSSWLNAYEKYMEAVGNSKTSVGIYGRALRAIFNRAIKDKDISIDIYPFSKEGYKLPSVRRVKKALSRVELKKLFEAIPSTPEQEKAKDFWFFSYSCNGVNIKDIALLRFENLQNDTFKFIRAKTVNTSKENLTEVVVYLTEHAKHVIEKYGNKRSDPKEFVFPILSRNDSAGERRSKIQNFTKFLNTHIKKLAIAQEINPEISTYFARHSFASNAIRQGASMEFVMEALSHSNIKTTKGYFAGFEDNTKREFMEKLMNF